MQVGAVMKAICSGAALVLMLIAVACASNNHPSIGSPNPTGASTGTIAGIVSTADRSTPVTSRKVTAINSASGARVEATTATNGGYTLQVPVGTYRLEVELRPGERLQKQPDPTNVGSGDLDAGRDFVITR
jgi:hypothetical protein